MLAGDPLVLTGLTRLTIVPYEQSSFPADRCRASLRCDLLRHHEGIRTGNARGRIGKIERATRPDTFRDYIIGDAIGLALCLGIAIWAIAGLG